MPSEAQRVIDAWLVPGVMPEYHSQMQQWLRHQWPVLADALDALANAKD